MKSSTGLRVLVLAAFAGVVAPSATSQEESPVLKDAHVPPEIVFLTHSAGFVHGVVKRPEPSELSFAERALVDAANGRFRVQATQDCGEINPERLADVKAVVFYTTGELPITDENKAALMQWVANGGALVGIHCATDTFYEYAPYVDLIGGTFDGHPWHEEVDVIVEEGDHPATRHLAESFPITDEIYQFRNFRRHPVRVLLSLEPSSVEIEKGKRTDGDYALAWCRDWGQGRVFYTALGHREEVWQDERFLEHLLGGIDWAIEGPDHSPAPPEGALVLFGGDDLEAWHHRREAAPASWKIVDEAMEVVPGTSDLISKESFGDALIHVEFRTPSMPEAEGQAKGNSGVYVHGRYEVQVLDSFGLEQGLGDCGSIYGKKIADQNACRPPEVWQSYDIEFTAPRFDGEGKKTADARMTVWHNGILIHDDVPVDGTTRGGVDEIEAATGPLLLQDHGNPVRYRNVWVLPR